MALVDVTVSAQYELPHHIWVTRDFLGQRFDTFIGQIRATIVMPTEATTGHPELPGVPDQSWDDEARWTMTWAGFGTDDKTALHRIGLELSEGARKVPAYYPYPETPDSEVQQAHKLGAVAARCMDEWFLRLSDWVEITTGEDINHRHPVYDASTIGPGFEYWDGGKWQTGGFRASTPTPAALTPELFQSLLDRVADFEKPPIEWRLVRDSVAACRRDDFRRAVLDAATAAEVCLIRMIEVAEDTLKVRCTGRNASGLKSRSSWLADHDSDYKPPSGLGELADLRNKAIHAGVEVDRDAAAAAARTATEIVAAYGRSRDPRRGES